MEKKIWFKQFGAHVINLEELGCNFKIKNLKNGVSCKRHKGVCAVRNVYKMNEWFNNFKNEL